MGVKAWETQGEEGAGTRGSSGSRLTPQSQQLHLICEPSLNIWAPRKLLSGGEGKGAIKKKRKNGSNQLFMVRKVN